MIFCFKLIIETKKKKRKYNGYAGKKMREKKLFYRLCPVGKQLKKILKSRLQLIRLILKQIQNLIFNEYTRYKRF